MGPVSWERRELEQKGLVRRMNVGVHINENDYSRRYVNLQQEGTGTGLDKLVVGADCHEGRENQSLFGANLSARQKVYKAVSLCGTQRAAIQSKVTPPNLHLKDGAGWT